MTQETTIMTHEAESKTHEAECLTSDRIQLWQNGVMITTLPLKEAKGLIYIGNYKIINSQAISWISRYEE